MLSQFAGRPAERMPLLVAEHNRKWLFPLMPMCGQHGEIHDGLNHRALQLPEGRQSGFAAIAMWAILVSSPAKRAATGQVRERDQTVMAILGTI